MSAEDELDTMAGADAGGTEYADPDDLPVLVARGGYGRDYSRESRGRIPRGKRAPKTLTESALQMQFFQMGAAEVKALQRKLIAGGLLEMDEPNGIHDEDTFAAYTTILRRAAMFTAAKNPVTLDEVLDQAAANPQDPSAGKAPFVGMQDNPETLRRQAAEFSKIITGRPLPPAVIDQIVGEYQANQIAAQHRAFDVQDSGGVVTQEQDFESFVQDRTEDLDPVGTETFGMKKNMDVFFKLLHGAGPGDM